MAEPKYNSKSKTWTGLVFSHKEPSGKRIYHSITASSKREWKQMEAEFKANKKGKSAADMTVGECVEQYIKSKEGVLSPSTIRGYRMYQKRFAPLHDLPVSKIESSDLQYFVSGLSADLTPKTVRNIYSLLMSSIALIDDRRFKVTLPAKKVIEYNTPTDNQVMLLMQSASPVMAKCIALAACGTLRRGEICGLHYDDIMRDFHAVYVHRSVVLDVNGKWIEKDMPKTSGSVRRVILPKEVISLLGEGDGKIIPITPNSITENFIKLRNRVGLSCRFHDLRHYSASVMHAIGIPDKYIMERGGWTDDRVLKAVYQNTLSDQSKVFTQKTNDHFSKILA